MTLRNVEKVAHELALEAHRQMAIDPYARPYIPPTKPEAIRKFVYRVTRQRLARHPDLTEAQRAEIIADGPAHCIEIFRARAAAADDTDRLLLRRAA